MWSQDVYLKPFNNDGNERFGFSVAIRGTRIVVGAYEEDSAATGVNGNEADNSAPASGAAYVYRLNGAQWEHEAYLKASNTESGDRFGVFVGIDGNKIVVGADAEASNATGAGGNDADNSAANSGAAYVYRFDGAVWSFEEYLKATNTEANDSFGGPIAISGERVAIAAQSEASNAIGIDGNQADNTEADSGAVYIY